MFLKNLFTALVLFCTFPQNPVFSQVCEALYNLPNVTPYVLSHPSVKSDFYRLSPPEVFTSNGDTCIGSVLVLKNGTTVLEARSLEGRIFSRYVIFADGSVNLVVYDILESKDRTYIQIDSLLGRKGVASFSNVSVPQISDQGCSVSVKRNLNPESGEVRVRVVYGNPLQVLDCYINSVGTIEEEEHYFDDNRVITPRKVTDKKWLFELAIKKLKE
ncbi:MAG TPA: hypothetical protein VJB09_00110 [Candidatus Paceibacterota bacterium]